MLLLEYYSIKVDSDLTQEYINISNRLSKYIPDIVEKVQKLNKTCEGKDKKVKSTIMDAMVVIDYLKIIIQLLILVIIIRFIS